MKQTGRTFGVKGLNHLVKLKVYKTHFHLVIMGCHFWIDGLIMGH